MRSPKSLVLEALNSVVQELNSDRTEIEKYFSPKYVQDVDGKVLDFEAFCLHAKELRQALLRTELSILRIVAEGDEVMTIHLVSAFKRDGSIAKFKVFAHFRIENERIISCEETTRLISGAKEDRDLDSRH